MTSGCTLQSSLALGQVRPLAGNDDKTLGGWDCEMWRVVKKAQMQMKQWAFQLCIIDGWTPFAARNFEFILVFFPNYTAVFKLEMMAKFT